MLIFFKHFFPYPDVCSQLQLLVGPALRRSKPLGHTQPPSLHRPLSDSFRTLPLFSVLHTTASFYFSLGHSWARGLYSPARPPSSLSSLAWHCSPSVRPGTPVPHTLLILTTPLYPLQASWAHLSAENALPSYFWGPTLTRSSRAHVSSKAFPNLSRRKSPPIPDSFQLIIPL